MSGRPVSLGIDLGTTSIKICLVAADTKEQLYEASKVSDSKTEILNYSDNFRRKLDSDHRSTSFDEQDVGKIWSCLSELVGKIPPDFAKSVVSVGVTGQQHGVILWNSATFDKTDLSNQLPKHFSISNLVTWQDQRCDQEFLRSIPQPQPKQIIATGYGCCSLLWYAKYDPEYLKQFDSSGTIMDFVVWMLIGGGKDKPVISPQNAETWGFYNRDKREWNSETLNRAGFSADLLPRIQMQNDENFARGTLTYPLCEIPIKVPVYVAMGDLQCSFRATIQESTDAVMNFSTSSQVTFIRPAHLQSIPNSCDTRSYFDGHDLIVAASLNGGNVLTQFVRVLQSWSTSMNANIPEETIWSVLISSANGVSWETAVDPTVDPKIFGERHDPLGTFGITGIGPRNGDLGAVVRGILKGVVSNLKNMLTSKLLGESGVKRMLLTGSMFEKFPQLISFVEDEFGIPVVNGSSQSAAYGAAVSVVEV